MDKSHHHYQRFAGVPLELARSTLVLRLDKNSDFQISRTEARVKRCVYTDPVIELPPLAASQLKQAYTVAPGFFNDPAKLDIVVRFFGVLLMVFIITSDAL